MERSGALQLSLALLIGMGLVGAGWWYHTRDQRDPRAMQLRAYLASRYASEPWYDYIKSVGAHRHDVRVHTDLPPWRDITRPLDRSTADITYPIYNILWEYVGLQHRELKLYHVFVYARDGTYLTGGAA